MWSLLVKSDPRPAQFLTLTLCGVLIDSALSWLPRSRIRGVLHTAELKKNLKILRNRNRSQIIFIIASDAQMGLIDDKNYVRNLITQPLQIIETWLSLATINKNYFLHTVCMSFYLQMYRKMCQIKIFRDSKLFWGQRYMRRERLKNFYGLNAMAAPPGWNWRH